MKKKRRPLTDSEFDSLCECISGNGNISECLRTIGASLSSLYFYLKTNPDERERITLARGLFHDDLTSSVRDLALSGVKSVSIRRKKGEGNEEIAPNVLLLLAVLKEHSSRLARDEKNDLVRALKSTDRGRGDVMREEILSDAPPGRIDIGKK